MPSRRLQTLGNLSNGMTTRSKRRFSALPVDMGSGERAIKDVYTRMTQVGHILLRPGMYVGQVERRSPIQCWVLESALPPPIGDTKANSTNLRIVRREHALAPALMKVFDEILVNASDNRIRNPDSSSRIDVTIHPGSSVHDPVISVFNDGKGIPIEFHETEKLYLPELLFGNLLTGSNFDDDEKRVTGGRHGYGAKLTNIFSKRFTVETVDSSRGLRYQQTWHDNMGTMEEAVITETSDADYTKITFVPDIPILTGSPEARGMEDLDYLTMCRRVVDIAGCAAGQLEVTLNGQVVTVPSFEAYSNLYRAPSAPPLCYHRVNHRWEVAIGLSENGAFDSVSFINGIAVLKGTHIDLIVQQVSQAIVEHIAKQYPELAGEVSPMWVRRQLFVSCNALIENPSFDSQMKESLTSSPKSWGSTCNFSQSFLDKLLVSQEAGGPGIVEAVVTTARGRQQESLSKALGRLTTKRKGPTQVNLPKLEDARWAGSKKSSECTLILTEGDSAKALAVAGLEVIGREKFGVFPLRGKFLNVRKAKISALTTNAELKALCSIIGLAHNSKYLTAKDRDKLRYGHIMLMTDQDNDGSHIKGLIINLFRHFWPELLKPPVDQPDRLPFLSSFVTPLLKATSKGAKKEVISFYSVAEYNEWRSAFDNADDLKQWSLKYYKGLGTSTPAEAKAYFAKFNDHVRPFRWNSDADGDLLDMVFDGDRAADRREWILENYEEESMVVPDPEHGNDVSFENFINKELIHYSNADNIRSLPSVVDGLKPSQRKVLYACFKRKLKAEVKVAQLTGYCAEHTAYHHGEASLQATIIGMAQDFVGSNNINLLAPQGQFGTRLAGGKDAASPRYIFTHLTSFARLLFPEDDDVLLDYRADDGQTIEPVYYCPTIPLLLVNGSAGIGTGWSTFIPPHNPLDIIAYIRGKLDKDETLPSIRPWAKGFTGDIVNREDGAGFSCIGKIEMINDKSIRISELPLGRWTNNYKADLLKMQEKDEILSFIEDHTTTTVSFTVSVNASQMQKLQKPNLETSFRLVSSLPTSNMNAYDTTNRIVRFESAEKIADAFFPTRYALYIDRKSVLQSEMQYNAAVMKNKSRFIQAVADGQINLARQIQTREQTISRLVELGFDDSRRLTSIRQDNALYKKRNTVLVDESVVDGDEAHKCQFDYLLNMPLSSLNSEKITALHHDTEKTELELTRLTNTSPEDLWRRDLDRLEAHLK